MAEDAMLQGLVDKYGAWNDKTLYDYGDDWQHVLLRVPGLCDQERHAYEELYHKSESDGQDRIAPPVEDYEELDRWLWDWSCKIATRLYVADRETIDDGKIKVFYLDAHGNGIWHHKLSADTLLEYNGAWHGMSLAEINSSFSATRENGGELFI